MACHFLMHLSDVVFLGCFVVLAISPVLAPDSLSSPLSLSLPDPGSEPISRFLPLSLSPAPRLLAFCFSFSFSFSLSRSLSLSLSLSRLLPPPQSLFSRVLETRAASLWFLGSPFRIDALDHSKHDAPISPRELTLSWIVIDPASGRAVNLSSRRPVCVDRHWFTGETLIRFATVVREFSVTAAVTCGEGEGHVREVSLVVEDADGIGVSGGESLGIIGEAFDGARRGRGGGGGGGRRMGWDPLSVSSSQSDRLRRQIVSSTLLPFQLPSPSDCSIHSLADQSDGAYVGSTCPSGCVSCASWLSAYWDPLFLCD